MKLFIKNLLIMFFMFNLISPANADTEEQDKIHIVTSFSILADMTRNIAGDRAIVNTIVGPNSDAHAFEPTPQNVKQLAGADLLIINGLNFEPWVDRLKQAAGFQANQIIATKNIQALHLDEKHEHSHDHDHGDIDPHAWQSLPNAVIYIKNITEGLIQADPGNSDYYRKNSIKYIDEILKLDQQIRAELETIPEDLRVILTSHDSFGYFAQEYNINFVSISGLSTTAEPSAKRIAAITNTIKNQHVSAIFLENMINNSILQQIAQATGSNIGGTLYSDALANDNSLASTYLGMMNWNANQIMDSLRID